MPCDGVSAESSYDIDEGDFGKDLCDAGFISWLEKKLACEKRVFVEQLQAIVNRQLQTHHRGLMEQVENQVNALFHTEESGGSATASSAPGMPSGMPSRRFTPGGRRSDHLASIINTGDYMGLASESLQSGGACSGLLAPTNISTPPKAETGDGKIRPIGSQKRTYRSPYLAGLSTRYSVKNVNAPWYQKVVESTNFELSCCFAILLNMAVICLEVQYTGCRLGATMDHPDVTDSCGWVLLSPKTEPCFTFTAVFFSGFFAMEFLLRSMTFGKGTFRSMWMWLDAIVLAFGFADTITRLGAAVDLGVNPTAMRTARIVRMLRMAKVFRGRDTFHTLFLLIKSIVSSQHALGWSLSILYTTMTCMGLLLNQLLYGYLSDPSLDEGDRRAIFDYFGTYTRMIITMFELTLGNWAPPSRLLMKMSHWWGMIVAIYRCVFCFCIVHVVAAVFISETNRVASDDEVMMLRKNRTDQKTARVLEELFLEIDASADGCITLTELKVAMNDNLMKNILEILDMDVYDMESLYCIMDDGSGKVRKEQFIKNVLRLRGPAKTSKLVAVMQLIDGLALKLEEVSGAVAGLAKASKLSSRMLPT